jgi:hypothetical protein
MTLSDCTTKKCALCGEESSHGSLFTTNAFGSCDLDLRPPEMERSTIWMWVQMCPSCGYCASDISEPIKKASEVVNSDSYKQQLNNSEFPKLANSFLCFSSIQEASGKYANAGWSCVHAAWACDDAQAEVGSKKCREKAVLLFQKAKQARQKFGKDQDAEHLLFVDLLRRSGQLDLALKTCEEGLSKNLKDEILNILRFQEQLINKSDIACHTVDETIKKAEDSQ